MLHWKESQTNIQLNGNLLPRLQVLWGPQWVVKACLNAHNWPEFSMETAPVVHVCNVDSPEVPGQAEMCSTNMQATQEEMKTQCPIWHDAPSGLSELPDPIHPYWPKKLLRETLNRKNFTQAVSTAYEEVIHWWGNLFLRSSGHAGTLFVSELPRLFIPYGEGSPLEPTALKSCIIMPA